MAPSPKSEERMKTQTWIGPVLILCLLAPVTPGAAVVEKTIQVISEETAEMTRLRAAVDLRIDELAPRLFELSDWMYNHPEPGFLEFEASARLTEELKKHGFTIEMGVPELPENFDRLKVIGGFPGEYDGPPGIPTASTSCSGATERRGKPCAIPAVFPPGISAR